MKAAIILITFWAASFLSYAQRNFNCRLLDAIAQHNKAFPGVTGNKLLLIDTFGFFTTGCSGRYGKWDIRVVGAQVAKPPMSSYSLGGIVTKDEGLGLGFVHPRSNTGVSYYFFILGDSIKIKKVSQVDF